MACPVCGGTEFAEIDIRLNPESDLRHLAGRSWNSRFMARCDDCSVLYDHQYAESGAGAGGSEPDREPAKVNCPDCGSRNAGDRETCSYCGSSLP